MNGQVNAQQPGKIVNQVGEHHHDHQDHRHEQPQQRIVQAQAFAVYQLDGHKQVQQHDQKQYQSETFAHALRSFLRPVNRNPASIMASDTLSM